MIEIIWDNVLDNRYQCFIKRDGEYFGTLHIWDQNNLKYLHTSQVYLKPRNHIPNVNRAMITEWEDMCMNLIDNYDIR